MDRIFVGFNQDMCLARCSTRRPLRRHLTFKFFYKTAFFWNNFREGNIRLGSISSMLLIPFVRWSDEWRGTFLEKWKVNRGKPRKGGWTHCQYKLSDGTLSCVHLRNTGTASAHCACACGRWGCRSGGRPCGKYGTCTPCPRCASVCDFCSCLSARHRKKKKKP